MGYIWAALICFAATVTFSVVLRTPKRAVLLCGAIATAAYLVYKAMGDNVWSYYVAALVITLGSEAAARIMRMPSAIFISTSVIPLVPGAGLFHTMRYMLEAQVMQALRTGAHTLLCIGAIALAIACGSLVARHTFGKKKRPPRAAE